MIKIYHNPRCSKSRQGLKILNDLQTDFEIIDYLKNPPTKNELKNILMLLGYRPLDLIRQNEIIWKENYKGKELSDEAIIKAMTDFPKLIERPIVINKNRAVIGRPPEIIKSIL